MRNDLLLAEKTISHKYLNRYRNQYIAKTRLGQHIRKGVILFMENSIWQTLFAIIRQISSYLNGKRIDAVGGSTSVYDMLALPEFIMSFQVDVVSAQPGELTAQQAENGKYYRVLFSQQIKAFGHQSTRIIEAYDTSYIRLIVTFNHKEVRAASGYVDVQMKAATVSIGNGSNRGIYLILPEGTGGSSTAYLGDVQLAAASTSAKAEVIGSNNYSCVVLKVQDGKTLAGSYSSDAIIYQETPHVQL